MRQTRKDFGITDAFILATANKLKAKIITGDPHFKELENTIMIK
jgi:predicted nucleic acid-binding protein